MKKIFRIGSIALLSVLFIFILGCKSKTNTPPKFKVGEKVIAIISGDIGMVIWAYGTEPYQYDVRFPIKQTTTNTHIFSTDKPISIAPLAIVEYMREYELAKYEDR